MKKIQRMSLHQFLNGDVVDQESFVKKAKKHIVQNKSFYIVVGGMTMFFLFCGFDGAAVAAGSNGIDRGMSALYKRLISIGKWILVIKGAIDVIQSVTTGDFEIAKKRALGYLLSFLILLGLPWAFGEMERLFDGLSTETGVGGQ
ncbi:MAG: hypothetical protein ACREBU_24715 [Nitrososphaera sp.]